MGDVQSSFALHEVVVLTGFTKHMLDYLARENILAPNQAGQSGKGKRRRYSYEDVVLLGALHAICRGRGKVRFLKRSLEIFRSEAGPMVPGQRIDQLLVVEGDKLCIRDPSSHLGELASGQLAFSFIVDLRQVTEAIASCVDVDQLSGIAKLNVATAEKAERVRQEIWASIKAKRMALN